MPGFMSRAALILLISCVHVLRQQWSVVGLRKEADELNDGAINQNDLHKLDHLMEGSASEPSDDDGDFEPFDDEADMQENDRKFRDQSEASSALHITDKITRADNYLDDDYVEYVRRRRYIPIVPTAPPSEDPRIPDLNGYRRQGKCNISGADPVIMTRKFGVVPKPATWKNDFVARCGQQCTEDASCVGFSITLVEKPVNNFLPAIHRDASFGHCQLKSEACPGWRTTEHKFHSSADAFFYKQGFCCLASTSSTDFCGNCVQESIANRTDWCGRSAPHCATCSGAKWCVGPPTPVVARNESLYVSNTHSLKHSGNSQMDPQVRKATGGLKTFCYVSDAWRHYAYLQAGSFKRGVQQTCFEAFGATNPPPLAGAMKYCDRRIKHWRWTWSRIEQGDDDGASRINKRNAKPPTDFNDRLMMKPLKLLLGRNKGRSADQYCFYAFPKEGRYRTQRICNAYSKDANWWYGGGYSYLSTNESETMPSWVEKEGRFCFWAFNVTSVRASRWPW